MKLITFFKAMAITGIIATTAMAQITSMSRNGPETISTENGQTGIPAPTFNGGAATFAQVTESDDFRVQVRANGATGDWVTLNHNASSGFVWDQTWGYYPNDGGGVWIHITRTTHVRLTSAANPGVYLDYVLNFTGAQREGNEITIVGNATREADGNGNLGISFNDIRIGGSNVGAGDNARFVYQIRTSGGTWRNMDDQASTWHWQSSGYNQLSAENQWGIWYEGGGGIWFRPVTQNYEFRIGYPENGQTGGAINNNWATFNFVGNSDAPRPDPNNPANRITLGGETPGDLLGWRLYWNDEFSGNSLDLNKWTIDLGYHLGNTNADGSDAGVNCGTWGWGNEERQHYSNDPKNVYVQDGRLHLVAHSNDPRYFPICNQTANYSSGKIHSRGKFSFKYGRIDFRISLPTITGTWPAAWMMPEHDVYGGWAASGEIDVMEARGRIHDRASGAIHFGGQWPDNRYIDGETSIPDGGTIADFVVYSVVWQEDSIKWYINGNLYFAAGHNQWNSTAANAMGNPYAPFDQYFHIILNLATGGWFDREGTAAMNPADFPATMRVDYVRVFKADDTAGPDPTQTVSLAKTKQQHTGFAGIRNGQISLRLPDGAHAVELYNVKGQLISSVNINAVNGINATGLRTDNLAQGVYILNVKRNGISVLQQRITPSR
jgi:beta-glucanase (GH16 family)